MAVGVMVVWVVNNVAPSWPPWPVRRELRLGAEGGETTIGGGSEAVPTIVTNVVVVAVFHASLSLCFSVDSFSFQKVAAAIASSSCCLFSASLARVGILSCEHPGRRTGVVEVCNHGANPHSSFNVLTTGCPDRPAMSLQTSRT